MKSCWNFCKFSGKGYFWCFQVSHETANFGKFHTKFVQNFTSKFVLQLPFIATIVSSKTKTRQLLRWILFWQTFSCKVFNSHTGDWCFLLHGDDAIVLFDSNWDCMKQTTNQTLTTSYVCLLEPFVYSLTVPSIYSINFKKTLWWVKYY